VPTSYIPVNQNDQWVVDEKGRVIGVRRFGQHYPPREQVFAETDPLTGGSVNIVVSNAAPSNGDGRPDGTIYVQTV
jgi:hypothetical protein